jgi:outer membrane cobalamin receptor
VLQDGASAIYGSDAIAGVVNIITKKRQKASTPPPNSADTRKATDSRRITRSAGATAMRVRWRLSLAAIM